MKNNAIHNKTIKQFLVIAAIWLHFLGVPILLQMTAKSFNFHFTDLF